MPAYPSLAYRELTRTEAVPNTTVGRPPPGLRSVSTRWWHAVSAVGGLGVAATLHQLPTHRQHGDQGDGEAAQREQRRIVSVAVEAELDLVGTGGGGHGDHGRGHPGERDRP